MDERTKWSKRRMVCGSSLVLAGREWDAGAAERAGMNHGVKWLWSLTGVGEETP